MKDNKEQSIKFEGVAWQGLYFALSWLQFWNLVTAQVNDGGKLFKKIDPTLLHIQVITEFWLAVNVFLSNEVDQDMVAIITKPSEKLERNQPSTIYQSYE